MCENLAVKTQKTIKKENMQKNCQFFQAYRNTRYFVLWNHIFVYLDNYSNQILALKLNT